MDESEYQEPEHPLPEKRGKSFVFGGQIVVLDHTTDAEQHGEQRVELPVDKHITYEVKDFVCW